jgi:hypothetical protein
MSDSLTSIKLWGRRAGIAGVVALVLAAAYGILNPLQFYRSYLFSYIYWLGFAIGCLPVIAIGHLVEGRWGTVIRRWLEAGLFTILIMAALFIPLLTGLDRLYPWARDGALSNPVIAAKSAYLNVPFFLIRAAAYFTIWGLSAWLLRRWSIEDDRSTDGSYRRKLQLVSGPVILGYAFAITFASIDWVMSLEPLWFSTIYGIIFMTSHALTALSFVIVFISFAAREAPVSGWIQADDFHDLGNLVLTFVSLWAYASFSQYLIIWSGNLPEEISWYHGRTAAGWKAVTVVLIVFHFVVPFILLLSRKAKRSHLILRKVAIGLLLARVVDVYWFIAPAYGPDFSPHWMDLLLFIGIGGIWFASFATRIGRVPLLPRLHDTVAARETSEGAWT